MALKNCFYLKDSSSGILTIFLWLFSTLQFNESEFPDPSVSIYFLCSRELLSLLIFSSTIFCFVQFWYLFLHNNQIFLNFTDISVYFKCILYNSCIFFQLQVPLVIFKREKEVARKLEFDGLYITEQPSEDDIKGQWDRLVINTQWVFTYSVPL